MNVPPDHKQEGTQIVQKSHTPSAHTKHTFHLRYVNVVRSFSLAGRDNNWQTACISAPEVLLRAFECQHVGMYVFMVISWGEGYQRGGTGGAHLTLECKMPYLRSYSSGNFFKDISGWVRLILEVEYSYLNLTHEFNIVDSNNNTVSSISIHNFTCSNCMQCRQHCFPLTSVESRFIVRWPLPSW